MCRFDAAREPRGWPGASHSIMDRLCPFREVVGGETSCVFKSAGVACGGAICDQPWLQCAFFLLLAFPPSKQPNLCLPDSERIWSILKARLWVLALFNQVA